MHAQRSQKLWCGEARKIEQDGILAMIVSLGYGVEQNPTNANQQSDQGLGHQTIADLDDNEGKTCTNSGKFKSPCVCGSMY